MPVYRRLGLANAPDDVDTLRSLVDIAIAQENYSKAHDLDRKLLDSGKALAVDYNNAAWHAIFTGTITPSDVENALKRRK